MQGQLDQALVEAEIACNCERPRFDMIVQKADILIDLNRSEAESEITRLNPGFAVNSDMKKALVCKLHVKKGEWGPAEKLWRSIWQKNHPSFQTIRKEMLLKKVEDPMLDLIEREQIDKESRAVKVTSKVSLTDSDIEELA